MQGIFRRIIHVSWHIMWLSCGVIGGIAVAPLLHLSHFSLLVPLFACLVLGVAFAKRSAWLIAVSLLAGFLLGGWRGGVEHHALQAYQPFYTKTVRLQGTVAEDTSYGAKGDQRIRLSHVSLDGHPLHGSVWVSTTSHAAIARSDAVTFHGVLGKGFGTVAATMFRATLVKDIRPHPGDVALHIRNWFSGGIHRAIPDPAAALGTGYLTGQRSSLPAALDAQLKTVGLTHAVVASGYNLTILVGFARRSLLKHSKYLATLATSLMIGSFMLITGLSPSMSRAGLVTGLSLAAWYYGRKIHPLVLLPFAAAVTAFWSPSYVWGDLGWYLSFTAFAGVVLIAPLIHHYFWPPNEAPHQLRSVFVETMSAQLATMPIIIFAFGQYSPYALLANMLVLPFIPLAMLLTFGAGIGGLAFPGAAQWIGLPAHLVLQYMIKVVAWVADLPGAQSSVHLTPFLLTASYAALAGGAYFLWFKTAHRFREHNITIPGGEV